MHMMIVIAAMAFLVVTPYLSIPSSGAPSENAAPLDEDQDARD